MTDVTETPSLTSGSHSVLLPDREVTVDKSIQWAYIHAIRNARHFLYIENQYFLGGSGEWENKVGL